MGLIIWAKVQKVIKYTKTQTKKMHFRIEISCDINL